MPRTAPLRIIPLYTGPDWVDAAPALEPDRATSATAARKACRRHGFRVLTVGGLVQVNAEGTAWMVTVHPEA